MTRVRAGTSSPAVTIGMSVRNAETTVSRALTSLLNQTLDSWRLLVVDDGSTDRTPQIVTAIARADSRVELIREQTSRGLPRRLNEILDRATGAYFARMDADDIAYPDRLERQLAFLDSNPAVDVVGSPMIVTRADGSAIGIRHAPPRHDDICARPHSGFPLFHPTWFGRLDWFRRFRYEPSAQRCEDQELLLRAYRSSRYANLTEPLLGYSEDRLAWRKLAIGRWNFMRFAAADSWRSGRRLQTIAICAEQASKGIVDALAIATHTESQLLGHRARPASATFEREWRRVWKAVT